MLIGKTIQLSGIRGAEDLDYSITEDALNSRIKIYLVPESVSMDRYYISITLPGATEDVPPSRGRDTLLLVDFSLADIDEPTIHYINEEVWDA